MITVSDRDVFLGIHLYKDTKEAFKKEAEQRRVGMSELASHIIEMWLEVADRDDYSAKTRALYEKNRQQADPSGLRDIPLPLEDVSENP